MDLGLPNYEFREEHSFELAKQALGWPDEELEEHLRAIQLTIGFDPLLEPWSVPLAPDSPYRVAVSSGTQFSPRAIRVIYRVEGNLVYFMTVEGR